MRSEDLRVRMATVVAQVLKRGYRRGLVVTDRELTKLGSTSKLAANPTIHVNSSPPH